MSILKNTDELQEILEQVNNLPTGSAAGDNCLVKDNIASDADVLDFVIDMNYIDPVFSRDNVIYTSKDGLIYIF